MLAPGSNQKNVMKKITLILAFLVAAFVGWSQTARLQIIHNSPTPTVDIWVNGQPFLTDFEYRTATPYVDVPAGVQLEIGVAPAPSNDPSDIIATFPVTLDDGGTYVAIASGIVGDAVTPFTLNLFANAREAATSADVDFIVNHGSTDAPAVDVIARGVATLVSAAAYGDVTPYITVPAADYTLDITPAGQNSEIVASYTAPLSGLGGGAAVVFASGFLAPAAGQPAFGLFAALPDGTVLELPAVQNTARVQIIHNSASPTVDIWVNGAPFLTNFEYRTATPYVDVPAGQTLSIGVAPSPSDDPSDIIATFPANFAPNGTYVVLASGIVGDPTTPFTLNVVANAREAATSGDVDFIVNHGSTDAPAVDVIARGVATLVSGAAYGDVTPYITVPAADYTLDITPAGQNSEIVASYTAPLSGLGGGAAVVFASGFLAPAVGQPAFGLFAALPDGTVLELPAVQNTARVQIIHNSASPTVDIWVNGAPFLTNFEYRTATPYVDVPAGQTLSIGVAPSPSDDPSDIIATFPANFAPNGTYVVLASGLVGDPTTPFTLNVVANAREAATSADVDFIVNHGSTDAPAVDVIARGVATLVSGAAYGDVTPYITVPAADYILDITPAGQNSEIVASYTAPLSGLGGGAAVVFASGFLAPAVGQPAFGLFAALPDGTVLELPAVQNTARVQIIHNSASPTVDIWVNGAPFLTNFEYRTATPYVDVPAGQTLSIGVAPSPSDDPSDIIATFPANFAPNGTYVVLASGLVGDPTTPFTLNVVTNAREAATSGDVDFIVNHGSTDAPAVDVIARGVATLVSGAAYGDVTPYITVPAADYTLDITPAGQNSEIVASYSAPLSGLGGGAAVVFASGFLAPAAGQPAFGLFAALPDGTVIELPAVQNTARVQIIHNSASPTVDIWVNGAPFLTNFEYRTATPFVDVPAGTTLSIGVAPSPSDDPSDIIATFPVNFVPGGSYYAVASGLVGDPTTPFTINLVENARESALVAGTVDVMVNHGSTDAPAVDVIARGVATIVNNAAYGDFTPYITVPAADYTLDITPAGLNNEIVASYTAPLSGLGGGAALVFASGFFANVSVEPFGLFAALPNGTVVALPAVLNTARVQIIHNSASPTVDIWVNDEPFLTNFEYRTATPYVDVTAGRTLNIGVAPSPSDDPSDIIATFPVNFDIDETYAVIASGLVGNATTPFTLNVVEGTREAATTGGVDFIVNHGSTDAPAVDVIARGVATIVSNAAYGDVTGYITVPVGEYILDITPTGQNNTIVASYEADLSGLGGGAAIVYASGFLSPANANEPAFGLWVALPDGTSFPLPFISSTNEATEIEGFAIYPNPASDFLNLDLQLAETTELTISLLDVSGKQVLNRSLGLLAKGQFSDSINISELNPGFYLLRLVTPTGTVVTKLAVE